MSKRKIAANQRRSLDVMCTKVESMAALWADYDPEMLCELEELADSIKGCIEEMTRLCTDDE
ncbi:hypothetical protein ABRP83_13910 [Pectobacterium brasiliense]|uniref:hypothetical protein n=1 Tax=Pectobacterium brasiliense TaxID=180957 RepID=UPI0032EACD7B